MKRVPVFMLMVAYALRLAGADGSVDPAPAQPAPKESNSVEQAVLRLPGLIADKGKGRVLVSGHATGLGANEIAEFLVIGEQSSHDYEALVIAKASPEDVRKGLMFIGLTPGRNPKPDENRFYAKGERVNVYFAKGKPDAPGTPVRAERHIWHTQAKATIPEKGFVFAGSIWVKEQGGTNLLLAAQHYDPFSIVSDFSDPAAILVTPDWIPQGEAYGQQVVNEAHVFGTNEEVTVILEPANRLGGSVADVELAIEAGAKKNGGGLLDHLRCSLKEGDRVLGQEMTFDQALERLTDMTRGGRHPFVELRLGRGLSLKALRAIAAVLVVADETMGIHIEPPPKGELYYRAFSPPDRFRDREQRIVQPLELHLRKAGPSLAGVLTRIDVSYEGEEYRPRYAVTEFPVASPGTLRKELDKQRNDLPVLLVFGPAALTRGELMDFIGPALRTHSTVHVFVDE